MIEHKSDDRNIMIERDNSAGGLSRWTPFVVVASVVVGFVTLSWYAYHAGTQAVSDEDLPVIEAEKTPMKEKPMDSGGMKFPNQDKSIYDTFSSAQPQPPKVERVLPKPEEPISRGKDTPSTWINEKLQSSEQGAATATKEKTADAAVKKVLAIATPTANNKIPAVLLADNSSHQVIAAEAESGEDQSETYVAHKTPATASAVKAPDAVKADDSTPVATAVATPAKTATPVRVATPVKAVEVIKTPVKAPESPKPLEAVKPVEVAKPIEKPVAPVMAASVTTAKEEKADLAPAAGGAYTVQLGAFRSEKEANDEWGRMQRKQTVLADKQSIVIRADLGSKGVYYRLRVTGLASAGEAKTLCNTLAGNGQACIVPTGK